MTTLIEPFTYNGRRYLHLEPCFVQLLVLYGRANVVEALDELGQSPSHYHQTTLRNRCEQLEAVIRF